jgi:hypothetical protein
MTDDSVGVKSAQERVLFQDYDSIQGSYFRDCRTRLRWPESAMDGQSIIKGKRVKKLFSSIIL